MAATNTFPIVVMGVSAAGKSVIGAGLADRLGARFVDGDDLHPPANVAKMAAGDPLDDADRAPWLDAIGAVLADSVGGVVIACSALKAAYRARLRLGAGRPIRFVHLDVAEVELQRRIAARTDHFMPPSLLADQLATLEWPGDERDVIVVDAAQPIDEVVGRVVAALD